MKPKARRMDSPPVACRPHGAAPHIPLYVQATTVGGNCQGGVFGEWGVFRPALQGRQERSSQQLLTAVVAVVTEFVAFGQGWNRFNHAADRAEAHTQCFPREPCSWRK